MAKSGYKILNIADGGSLQALQAKGNLDHVRTLYNPGDFFDETHIATAVADDLNVSLGDASFRVHHVPLPWRLRRFCTLFAPWTMGRRIAQIVREHDIDVIRARGPYLAGSAAVIAGRLSRRPVVLSLGGDHRTACRMVGHYAIMGSRWLSEMVETLAVRSADRIFCINEYTRQYVLQLGARRERTRYVPLRIDLQRFDPQRDGSGIREELGIGSAPLVLFSGRLERDKQVDVIIEAIPPILQQVPETQFVFLGDGSLRPQLHDRLHELNVVGQTHFPGFQPNARVAEFLAAADVVWIPMSGFVIYEAAAAAKPIVAFDVEWHSEFVEHEETGLLVPDRKIGLLAEAVVRLLRDKALADKLAKNARTKMEQEFDPAQLAEKEIALYVELLEEEARRKHRRYHRRYGTVSGQSQAAKAA